MPLIKLLQCGYPKSGNYLLYKILSAFLRKQGLLRSLTSACGLGAVIDVLCSEYKTFPEISELDNLRVTESGYHLEFPHPQCRSVPVALDLLLQQSSLIWTHEVPTLMLKPEVDVTHKFYIVRDGRDVINSIMHYVTSALSLRLRPEYKYDSATELYGNLEYFEKCVIEWATHVQSYMDNEDAFHLVRFEHLVQDKHMVIGKLAKCLEIAVSKNDIDNIVNETDLIQMRKSAPQHVRRGRKGDWRNYFSAEHRRIFKVAAGHVLIAFGYERDLNW